MGASTGDLLSLPLPLRSALESGRCVLFVGSGVGGNAARADGTSAPVGRALAEELAARFGVDAGSDPQLTTVAEVVAIRRGRAELDGFLSERLADLEPDEHLRWIASIRWAAIFTTNYDDLIERAYDLTPNPPQAPIPISVSSEVVPLDLRFQVPVYHLHGSLLRGDDRRLIITGTDYSTFRERRRMLFELLKLHSSSSTVLYLGYSHKDPNWGTLLAELREDFFPSTPPLAYRVAPGTSALEKEVLEAQNVHTIDANLEEFVAAARTQVVPPSEPGSLDAIRAAVPPELVSAFDEAPAAMARLLGSWTYVNAAPFSEQPNTVEFLRGDPANWGVIGRRIHFERDVEEGVMAELLDYATSSGTPRRLVALLGPAGFGMSTALRSLAARLAMEKAGPIFLHRPGTPLREGDVVFGAALSADAPFFLVDNAADVVHEVARAIFQLGDLQRPVLFLVAERLSEWRTRSIPFRVSEHGLEVLSEGEIERLLDLLAGQGALSRLAELDRPLQRAAIREKSEKQLLVAMREATEGRGFDAIIEDEFRGLGSDLARRAYAAVSAFYRLRTYVRDSVLAASLDMALVDLYDQLGQSVEGVIRFDLHDEASGEYAARARHHVIAEIVWERCVEPGERELILSRALAALNLNYYLDRAAFDAFVGSDRTVDSIQGFEGRVAFFETARRKDPMSPYVLQHYARMLLRSDKPDLALGQIDGALTLYPRGRVLHHTRGVILRHLALSLDSTDMARRRLVQSEEAFRQALRIDERDAYAYQSMAELYLGWAKRVEEPDEASVYVTKAEETIAEGLRRTRDREGLWVVFAELEKWLGNTPAAMAALGKSVAANPVGKVGPFLLGRAYRRSGRPEAACEVLARVLEAHPEEHRSALEYARALLETGEPRTRAIAVLELSRPYGFTDAAYIGMLGGLLFMEKRFSEAQEVFDERLKQQFSFRELSRVVYRAKGRDGSDERFVGTVRTVRTGYAFLEVPGYPSFYCPASRFGDLVMKVGLKISFQPGFCAKGNVVVDPREGE